MRWSASAPVTWPADHRWQRVWSDAVAPLPDRLRVEADGVVRVAGAGSGDPRVLLVGGTHLQPGAEYRIAPELTVGLLRAWVGAGRAAGLEWAPYAEAGRAHVEVVGLDRLQEVRAAATLEHLAGRVRFAPHEPARALDVEVEVAWLRAAVVVGVDAGQLRVEVSARGLGIWWPTLAPVFLGGRATFQRELETAVADLASALTGLAVTGDLELTAVETHEQRTRRYERLLREGLAELGLRQRGVADIMAALPWWRRTRGRWRAELAALRPVERDGVGLLHGETWASVEQELTDAVLRPLPWRREARLAESVSRFTDEKVAMRLAVEAAAQSVVGGRSEPWLTDASFDLSWLATPTRLLEGWRAS